MYWTPASGPAEVPAPIPRTKDDGTKLTKAQRKKLRKKRRKEEKKTEKVDSGVDSGSAQEESNQLKVDIDYIAEEPDLDPMTMQFNKGTFALRILGSKKRDSR